MIPNIDEINMTLAEYKKTMTRTLEMINDEADKESMMSVFALTNSMIQMLIDSLFTVFQKQQAPDNK